MSIPSSFDHRTAEKKWYQYWLDQQIFRSVPDERPPYAIVIPPPNVTGVLHMGHMLNNTLQDVLIRRARLRGFNACWVPGTDHASIATEARVVNLLKQQGISKDQLTREEFLEHAWAWTRKHGGIIQQQLRHLGASCDWEREAFTLDEARSQSVLQVFVDLYRKGLIYRGYRMVNWDPEARTSVSDEEVIHRDVDSKLYHLRYRIQDSEEYLSVATTRPETIFGDVAVCVNPEDERYRAWIGQKVTVPVVNREVPIIADDYVDPEFGTGCLKITPAHDPNDLAIGNRHGLEVIDSLNEDGKLNAHGLHYKGMDRFAARERLVEELRRKGLMEREEEYHTSVGTSERTGAVIEPRLSEQWFLKISDLARPALEAVMKDEVKLIPEKFKNTYRHWMENVHDWCISRQLWWGHQIPAWYYGEGDEEVVVAENEAEALRQAREKSGRPLTAEDLKREEDVLDTWFSAWLWPISVFDGIRKPDNPDIKYYYPTRDLVTAPEILFFWVARMLMSGYHYRQEKPFANVYLTGIVRDKEGRKMSKSLGNSPDPIELMEKYSADAVRVGMMLTSPAGNDLPFDEELCLQGRNFAHKLWNALRLVKGWTVEDAAPADPAAEAAVSWFAERLKQATADIDRQFEQYRLSDALMATYKLAWDDFCSWYLEAVKPAYGKPVSPAMMERSLDYFVEVLILLHPYMPFVTEEIWQRLRPRGEGESIGRQDWPAAGGENKALVDDFKKATAIVVGVRNLRATKNIPPREALELYAPSEEAIPRKFAPLISKMAHLQQWHAGERPDAPGFTFLAGTDEFYIPAGQAVDLEAERSKLEKDLSYQQGFLSAVDKKLANTRFVENAPPRVVEAERQKKADAEAKIESLKKRLAELQ